MTTKKHPISDFALFRYFMFLLLFEVAFVALMLWSGLLKDYVSPEQYEKTALNLTLIFAGLIFLNIREGLPVVISIIRELHYENFAWSSESRYDLETRRIMDERLRWFSFLPKARFIRNRHVPINLKQWVQKRSYSGHGYIYILKDIEVTGHYKIGKTRYPRNRMTDFGVQLPFEVELIHVIEVNNVDDAERQLHKKFARKRGRGEWFALTPSDLEWLKNQHHI